MQDWLTKTGKAKGDITHWIDTITKETYRWPRHVHSYATLAARVAKKNDGNVTEEGLRLVMEKGREERFLYYKARLKGFTAKERRSIARILVAVSGDRGIEEEDAVEQLDKEYGAGKGREIFFRAVRKGVFHIDNETARYSVPIPSMRDYIIKKISHRKRWRVPKRGRILTWGWRGNLSPA